MGNVCPSSDKSSVWYHAFFPESEADNKTITILSTHETVIFSGVCRVINDR